ncbi:MAG: CBS domain-containing protein [Deltaproteobacteria bacterium]|nr:CBS domain-containing protein [Deltaproteobacteria bacterium]
MLTPSPGPTVGEYMTTAPMTVAPDLSIRDARERMMLNNLRHLVVVGGDRIVGVVSSRDLDLASSIPAAHGTTLMVTDAMTKDPYCCVPMTPLSEVARAMEAKRYGCALVLEGEHAIGIFTTTDALRALRALISGKPVQPVNPPTHVTEPSPAQARTEHHARLSSSLGPGVRPSPNQGRIG